MAPRYQLYAFDQLTAALLHDILMLRQDVFIVEQDAIYNDIDGLDTEALHLCLFDADSFIGYARILPPGSKFAEASVGRVVLNHAWRGKGLGRGLMQRSIIEAKKSFSNAPIRIEALHDLLPFYQSLGFVADSEVYDWAGLPYVKMVTKAVA